MTTFEVPADQSGGVLSAAAVVVESELEDQGNLIQLAMAALRFSSGDTRKPPSPTTICGGLEEIPLQEVAEHDSCSDCWIVIYDRVYDVTQFLESHPGGFDVILEHAGRDATFAFRGAGHSLEAAQMLKKFEIGILPPNERLYRTDNGLFAWDDLPE